MADELAQRDGGGIGRLSALAAGARHDDHLTYFLWQRLMPQFQQCSGLRNELDVIDLTVRSNSLRRGGAPMVKKP